MRAKHKSGRRHFLKVGLAAGASLLVRPKKSRALPLISSPVYVSHSAGMYSSNAATKKQAIRDGVDSCVVELAKAMGALELSRVGQAWEHLLGNVTADKVVAIHVACFNNDYKSGNWNSPQFETLESVVLGLRDMLNGQFLASQIRVFDNNMGNYNRLHAAYTKSSVDALGVQSGSLDYDSSAPMTVNGRSLYPHVYLAEADYAINVARLSGHQFAPGSGPGISGCVKGLMGATSGSTGSLDQLDTVFHDSNKIWRGHKEFWNIIRPKVKLSIMDMVKASETEKAAFTRDVGEICLGLDPCAIDGYASSKLNQLFGSTYAGLSIPNAVAGAVSGWSTEYAKVDCPIPPNYSTARPTRRQIEEKIRDRRNNQASDEQVKQLIESYRK